MTISAASQATRVNGAKGVGATYWGDVERGDGGRRGQKVTVRASGRALAAMASVVGVTPDQLTEIGREDAARVLAEMLRREPPAPARIPLRRPPMDEADEAAFDAKLAVVRARIADAEASEARLAAIDGRPVRPVTGIDIFPDSPKDARHWDDHIADGIPPGEAAEVLAFVHLALQRRAEQGRGHAAGLRLARP